MLQKTCSKRLREVAQAMNREDLLAVVNRLISNADEKLVASLLKNWEQKVLPSQVSMLSASGQMARDLVYSHAGAVLLDYSKDLIEITREGEGRLGGLVSRDIILYLHSKHRDAGIVPSTGIPFHYKDILSKILTVAGFTCDRVYIKHKQRTERVWVTREGYKHLSVDELINLFNEKLQQVTE